MGFVPRQTHNSALVRRVAGIYRPAAETASDELRVFSLGVILSAALFILFGASAEMVLLDGWTSWRHAAVLFLLGIPGVAVLYALRAGVGLELVADLTIGVLYLSTGTLAVASGGSAIPALYASLLIPTVAALFRPIRVALAWGAGSAAVALIAWGVRSSGVDLLIPPSDLLDWHARVSGFFFILVLSMAALVAHEQLKRVRIAESVESARLQTVAEADALRSQGESDRLRALSRGLAHELNNLLFTVRANAEVAFDAPQDIVEESLEAVIGTVDRASSVIADLRNYAATDSKFRKTVAVGELLEDARSTGERIVEENIKLDCGRTPDAMAIEADPDQIASCLVNLIKNAAEAIGKDQGRIELSTGIAELTAQDLEHIRCSGRALPGKFVQISVDDTGPGFEAGAAMQIFDAYHTTRPHGRGLGLTIVARVAETHCGAVRVSNTARGGRVEFLLPLAEAVPALAEPEGIPLVLDELRILVVDDEDAVRKVTARLLERNCASVTSVDGGEAAIETFAADPGAFDLALIDLSMPGLSGEEVLHALRTIRSNLPVVIVSGHADREFDHLAAMPMVATLRKPFSLHHLVRSLRDIRLAEPQGLTHRD